MCGVKANVNTVGLDHRGIFEDCDSALNSKASSMFEWAQRQGEFQLKIDLYNFIKYVCVT